VGSYLMVHRLVRCNPWCQGGCDPVPSQTLFSRFISNSSEKKPS
jgi:putative component of membrane protein insertase Oxa1/YidC/SpoIIIJ protein YidD